MPPKRRCSVCGSSKWRKESSTGVITCSEGHMLQNYRDETTEAYVGPHSMRKRTLKVGRRKSERTSHANPKLYHGDRGRFHYFQCLQLILRMQVATLTKLWGLPPEFEIVCRDIWALHLSLLPDPPPPEPYYFHERGDGMQVGSPSAKSQDSDRKKGGGSSADSESSSTSEDEEMDNPQIAQLMQETSDINTSSEEDELAMQPLPGGTNMRRPPPVVRKRKKGYNAWTFPASNIAVLVVACWTLRLPVTYMDFVQPIESYDLPYLEAHRLLPNIMTEYLTKHTKSSLSPRHPPRVLALHKRASRLARNLQRHCCIEIPEANAAPLLWRTVRALGCSPVLYSLVKTTAQALDIPLVLQGPYRPLRGRVPKSLRNDDIMPELALTAVAVVVLKMVYGFDSMSRGPKSPNDPAWSLPSYKDYLATLERLEDQSKRRTMLTSFHLPVQQLADDDLDRYLAFCEKALLRGADKGGDVMPNYFPLPDHQSDVDDSGRWHLNLAGDPECAVASVAVAAAAESGAFSDLMEPAQAVRVYSTHDVLGEFPTDYRRLLEAAARWVGVGVEDVNSVVERYERRLVRWWDRIRREEHGGSDEGESGIVEDADLNDDSTGL